MAWLGRCADPALDLAPAEARLIKGLQLQGLAGAAIRAIYPTYRPVCGNFPEHNLVVLSDGTMTTCCKDSMAKNVFASLAEKTLEAIWSEDVDGLIKGDLYALPLCRQSCIGTAMAPLRTAPERWREWSRFAEGPIDSLTIEIMGACNYACCIGASVADHRRNRQVKPDLGLIFESIRSMLPRVQRLRLFNFGEPLLHPGFVEFMRKCRAASPRTRMLISTNAMLLNEEIARALVDIAVEHIVVSVHGGPGTENMLRYSLRGADYDTVLRNVGRLLEIRNSQGREFPKIGLRSILFHWNDTEELMDRFRRDAQALGLTPNWGHFSTDNYHWIHDCNGLGERASARFRPGSEALEELLESREFFAPKRFEESAPEGACSACGGRSAHGIEPLDGGS